MKKTELPILKTELPEIFAGDAVVLALLLDKENQKERIRIDVSRLRKYFPKSYTTAQMEKSILRMLEEQHKKKQRSKEIR